MTHIVILRACAADTDAQNAEARIAHAGEPDEATLAQYRQGITDLYLSSFGSAPERIGVAVLPYVDELDEDMGEQAYHWKQEEAE